MKNMDPSRSMASAYDQKQGPAEQGTRINGLQQVIDLLEHADPAFRESLLKRLTQRDPQLAQNLKRLIG